MRRAKRSTIWPERRWRGWGMTGRGMEEVKLAIRLRTSLHTPARCATPLHSGDLIPRMPKSPLMKRGARRAGCVGVPAKNYSQNAPTGARFEAMSAHNLSRDYQSPITPRFDDEEEEER